MGRPNKFKYVCLDCAEATFFSRAERIKAARMRCARCGSIALEPSAYSEARTRLPLAESMRGERAAMQRRAMGYPT